MTREEAIATIKELMKACTPYSKYYIVGDMAIKALEEPCEDDISREDALMCLTGEIKETDTIETIIARFGRRIRKLSSVNPQPKTPKTGHWEWVQYDYNPKIGNWHCSECRSVVMECVDKNDKGGIPLYKYCPQCGAKMFEPQEREKGGKEYGRTYSIEYERLQGNKDCVD